MANLLRPHLNNANRLTVGSTSGSIRDLFTKVKAIDAKHGKFDLVLCAGDFFGSPKDPEQNSENDDTTLLLDGKLEAPLEFYIMQGEHPLPSQVVEKFAKTGGELCKNVFLMSKSGIITTANGLRIACLAGIYDPEIFSSAEAAPGFLSPYFSSHTVDRLLSNTLAKGSTATQKSYSSLASIQASASSSQLIDILLTYEWPTTITQFSSTPLPDPKLSSIGAPPLNDVVRKTKPRYHFAAGGGRPPHFWEREPYVWEDEQGRVARFISLGAFGGEAPSSGKKQRWFYAFNIEPASPVSEQVPRPANATENPFLGKAHKRPFDANSGGENFIFGNNHQQPQKRARTSKVNPESRLPGTSAGAANLLRYRTSITVHAHFITDCPERTKPPENYICKVCHEPGHFVRDCPTRDARGDTGGRKPKPGYVCRACGSEDHYLEDCLVAKQGPVESERRGGRRGPPKEIARQIIPTHSPAGHATVPGGGHVLVVPITHYPTYSTIPPDLAPPIVEETEQFKKALSSMYAKYGCVPVIFEVGRLSAKGGHAHIQVVPIPSRLKSKVEEAFVKEGRATGVDFEDDPEAAIAAYANGKGSYFKVDLPDGRKMVHLLKDNVPFSLQFGSLYEFSCAAAYRLACRQVLVNLLGTPDRLDWKACMLSEEEDKADAQAFKTAFAPFNPAV
ncbi:LOW QUALITY PROTEIN: hypothetical protein CVT26_011223 [Gymnopilus dilepis]|uniref:CCHC-type domain-containing protein n=1 Tax=Gymnopilus dilepis TaxID=231916 RepID=A0A409VJN8_9AGAR|nr:LOW QUALITY PROTEIN: hypothetical protein CVT26_011223 [Gymnopilus dilepis]